VSAGAVKIWGVDETIVLLHGFSGTHRTWDGVVALLEAERYSPQALDLRGHGAASERRPIGFAEVVDDVLAAAPERFVLCGYSMGGRIALHVALAAPERVTRLVLIGATAGISVDAERAERRASDEALAARVERGTIEEFVATWRDQPLFAGDPAWVAEAARGDQRRNDPGALAAVLRGLGTGAMEPLWDRLGELTMPVTLVAGERDAKFRDLAERLRAALPDARVAVVPGAGHAVHLEAPAAVVALITER
jgi:2-succinyl-6-hydroxy-2,4-cyclohexadiene-1-carboxylate synthase